MPNPETSESKPATVFLKNAAFFVQLGVTDQEQQQPQRIELDLSWRCDIARAAQSDALEHSLDYFELWTAVKDYLSDQAFRLIERLAEGLCLFLLERYPAMQSLTLELRKPAALAAQQVQCAGIRLSRSRADLE